MITDPALSHEHEVLLRATLGHGRVVIDAWNEWQQRFDLVTVDADGYVLLPQLYLRLRQLDVAQASPAKLRGIYRHTWCRNQVIMTRMAGALSLLRERGIGCLLLDGAAVMATSPFGLRPLEQFGFLVPGTRFADATAIFRREGGHSGRIGKREARGWHTPSALGTLTERRARSIEACYPSRHRRGRTRIAGNMRLLPPCRMFPSASCPRQTRC